MQQAVTSSQISLTPSTSIVISFLNRSLLKHKLNSFLQALNQCVQELKLTNFSDENKILRSKNNLSNQIDNIEKETKSNLDDKNVDVILLNLIHEYKSIDLDKSNHKLVIDPLLEPLLNSLNNNQSKISSSFFENKYGFSEKELLNTKFNDPIINKYLFKRNRLTLLEPKQSNLMQYNPSRGFKTQRKLKDEESNNNIFSLKNLTSSTKSSADEDPFKVLNALLNQPAKVNEQTSKGAKLGSIFPDQSTKANISSKLSDLKNFKSGDNETENKIKQAFVEGFLYKQVKDDKISKKNSNVISLIRFFTFMIILFLIFNSISISTVSNGNGKNGPTGGINIRALTGNMNFEVNPEQVHIRFEDVKGLPEAKKELTDIVDFLKDPEKYTKLGARLPKGVLLVGPPGCGKTLLAKSVAGEAGVPFFQASGSDFDEMFVGTGSKRVRQLFAAARAKAPCVIFIDEIDSVGSTRTNSMIHPHANQTINQLLAEMDGFQKNEGVIVLGATNRRDTLDSALMRPGRFDVEVRIDKPDLNARIEILDYYLDKVAKDKEVDVKFMARQLAGFGGSAIENIVNQAALRAAVEGFSTVKMEHLEWALDRTLLGYGKSRLTDEECNKNTAYHEAGHVLVAYYTKDSDPLHKVTILPRSQSLGHTAFVPENEGYSKTKSQLLAQMDVSMGGRVAEELIFGTDKVTTGASADFRSATNIATQMVKILGMSEKVGQRVFEEDKNGNGSSISPQTQELLDQEIKKMLQESYDRAKSILKIHSVELKLIADALLQHETLDVDQIKSLIENHKL